MFDLSHERNPNGLRVIRTGRTEDAINEAARAGLWPLVKRVQPSPEIRSKFAVVQDVVTGEIDVLGDFRMGPDPQKSKMVIGFTFYYPHHFECPYAAYLLPADLAIGEKVFLEDLIEDRVGGRWNQGDTFRLESAEATWNGSDFEIDYDPDTSPERFIG